MHLVQKISVTSHIFVKDRSSWKPFSILSHFHVLENDLCQYCWESGARQRSLAFSRKKDVEKKGISRWEKDNKFIWIHNIYKGEGKENQDEMEFTEAESNMNDLVSARWIEYTVSFFRPSSLHICVNRMISFILACFLFCKFIGGSFAAGVCFRVNRNNSKYWANYVRN